MSPSEPLSQRAYPTWEASPARSEYQSFLSEINPEGVSDESRR
jgi:hypothetical protein